MLLALERFLPCEGRYSKVSLRLPAAARRSASVGAHAERLLTWVRYLYIDKVHNYFAHFVIQIDPLKDSLLLFDVGTLVVAFLSK